MISRGIWKELAGLLISDAVMLVGMAEVEEYTSKIASLLTCLCTGGDSARLGLDGLDGSLSFSQ